MNDQSLPLYNNATQARKAPGSTFKPITAVAGLEEQVLGLYDTITCTGIYDIIKPAMRCWIYPGSHGPENVVVGIRNSCNFFSPTWDTGSPWILRENMCRTSVLSGYGSMPPCSAWTGSQASRSSRTSR